MKPTEPKPISKICEACGKEFSCTSESGNCWCFELKLNVETLVELKTNYKNCLCQECLKSKEIAD